MGDVVGESVESDSLGIPGPPNGEVDGEPMSIAVLCFDLKVPAKQRRFVGRSELGQATAVGVAVARALRGLSGLRPDRPIASARSSQIPPQPGCSSQRPSRCRRIPGRRHLLSRGSCAASPRSVGRTLRLGKMLAADTQQSDHEQTGEGAITPLSRTHRAPVGSWAPTPG